MSPWIRQFHRWMSIAFILGVILNSVVIWRSNPAPPPSWIYAFALIPLFLLLFSGLYLFALPYAARWRAARRV